MSFDRLTPQEFEELIYDLLGDLGAVNRSWRKATPGRGFESSYLNEGEAAVPISFLVDPHFQLVRTTYLGLITLVDVATYVRSLVDRGLLNSAHLVDARHATLSFSPEDTKILAELMSTLRGKHGSGPVAFVVGDAPSYHTAGAYHDLGAGGNPRFAVFGDVAAAEMWLKLTGS